ncbi:tRNA methyltransferase complex GCD14 subunit [Tothia fuscella]|uniref:tRNA (adenine(58)-N(1))-methyltransferase catalytic subunit TRM61 n=1 Tax=Tothia fuscella TaxID=1048955 RepID=A0A9P4U5F8_9PEZI|nr:tRNA methyltransferase complex GCD14 subunit [Tothia fuscella]
MTTPNNSPFLYPAPTTVDQSLGIISLKRDLQVPILLRASNPSNPTDEITNTRFGSFPHSTLLNRPWGSQVIASKVETSDSKRGRKRKREGKGGEEAEKSVERAEESVIETPAFEAATSGFAHILPPTPELWTVSLPHRTQVVYTPDYSFILQRLRVRAGETIIEAGAGSGSFTHAAARAVFNGIPHDSTQLLENGSSKPRKKQKKSGKVCSFEYHQDRHAQLQKELTEHGLSSIVKITHRDVYEEGFSFENGESPNASAILLDLPAPWTALKHLSRTPSLPNRPSPLNPKTTARICTFSPCIEQVEKTITAMRSQGWTEITMYEMQHKRLDVRRELTSLNYEGLRGVNASAASVEEAVCRLRELTAKFSEFHADAKVRKQVNSLEKYNKVHTKGGKGGTEQGGDGTANGTGDKEVVVESKRSRLERIKKEDSERKVWREGKLVHRSEMELKTHTSFLVFAILPREWSGVDEERCGKKKWGGEKAANEDQPATIPAAKSRTREKDEKDSVEGADVSMADS